MRVRRIAPHPQIAIGTMATIDIVYGDGIHFQVITDDGGFNGWSSFEQWALTKKCQRCGHEFAEGPTSADRDRFFHAVCGGCSPGHYECSCSQCHYRRKHPQLRAS
jgi:hypothetical protein